MSLPQTRNGLIARNSILNFAGQFIPLIVGVASIPFVIKGLGVDSFGILSLAWMIVGYFTVFDLGLGRATTKFIAEELRNGLTDRLRTLFWTSSGMNLLLGFAGGLIIAGMAPFLAESVFRIPKGLIEVTKTAFFILAFSCPIVLVSTAFRGALEAAQRFEFVNAVAVISSSLTFLLPVIGLLMGLGVQGIILLLMISRLCSALAYLLLCFRVFPILREGVSFDFKRIGRLLTYGGWVSVTNVLHPVLSYLDRVLIGSVISIAAVAYYTAPYEMVTRLSILPTSLTMTLFPSFSAVDTAARESLTSLYSRSVKVLLVLMGPLVAVLILFADEILRLWLGSEFAEIGAVVFQILAVGVLLNALAQVPFALIQGFGRPDITAKVHLLELLMYVPLVWLLVKNLGIVGGALAWTIRVMLDSLLLFAASGRLMNLRAFLENGLKRAITVVVLLMCVLFVPLFVHVSIVVKAVAAAAALLVFALTSWRFVFDTAERELLVSTARHLASITRGIR